MPTLTVDQMEYEVPERVSLGEALSLHAPISAPCGGHGLCGKCRVTARGALSPPTAEEKRCLGEAALAQGVRLACQARVLGAVAAERTPAEDLVIQTGGLSPAVPQNPLFRRWGMAVDIGTTTLAATLLGPSGEVGRLAAPNPQAAFGADVLSRVGRALEGQGGALARCIRGALAELVTGLCAKGELDPGEIDTLVVTGNTAMLYLLTEQDPACLAAAPFRAGDLFGRTISARALDLPCENATVWLPPCASAFVGADFITALLASGLCQGEETALLADIGTNGEMGLWHRGQLTCCSTAAGPAFEGGGLSMGMNGAAGAIDHVWVRAGVLEVSVLGGIAPRGLCGSGAIDGVAALLALGQMDETGALEEDPAVLASPVVLTQRDIRALQVAKSAIRAGLETLLTEGGVGCEQVSRLCVAGGFGSYLSVPAAAAIGLLPPALEGRTEILGNAALSGAVLLLQNRDVWPALQALADGALVLDLNKSPAFSNYYVEHMLF